MGKRTAAKGAPLLRAAVYTRVSTEDQATNGVSLAMQEERLRAYCKAHGWKVTEVYRDDGHSAKTLSRPALQRLLDDAKSGRFSAVCVFRLDRLTRRLRDLLALIDLFEKGGVSLVSLSESLDASTAAGRLALNIFGSVAQWEREVIGKRIAETLRYKRDRLESYGPLPYGFGRTKNGGLEPLDGELGVVKRIYALRSRGKTFRAIAERLNRGGVPTKNGGKWFASTVRYVLHNDLYAKHLKGAKR